MRNADVDMNVNVEEQIVAALETGDAKQVARTLSDREKVLAEELTQTILAEAASVVLEVLEVSAVLVHLVMVGIRKMPMVIGRTRPLYRCCAIFKRAIFRRR